MMPSPGKLQGCGRGVFGLSSWEPLRKPAALQEMALRLAKPGTPPRQTPGQLAGDTSTSLAAGQETRGRTQEGNSESLPVSSQATGVSSQNKILPSTDTDASAPSNGSAPVQGTKLKAGYSYKANPESPLGDPELSMKQGEMLKFVEEGPNEHWWVAENAQGQVGYVPASYMVVIQKTVGLPWLQNRQAEEEKSAASNTFGAPPAGLAKPYRSAYEHRGLPESKEYYCELCTKQLNGPQPYRAHMVGKAHREEEESAREYGRL